MGLLLIKGKKTKQGFYENSPVNLELGELLVGFTWSGSNLDDVESDGLGDWSTLTSSNDVTDLDTESWRNVDGDVLVSLFESVVLCNVM